MENFYGQHDWLELLSRCVSFSSNHHKSPHSHVHPNKVSHFPIKPHVISSPNHPHHLAVSLTFAVRSFSSFFSILSVNLFALQVTLIRRIDTIRIVAAERCFAFTKLHNALLRFPFGVQTCIPVSLITSLHCRHNRLTSFVCAESKVR